MQALAHRAGFPPLRLPASWRTLLGRFGKSGVPRLDVEALPDHLKRDLGLLGGHAAPRRDPMKD